MRNLSPFTLIFLIDLKLSMYLNNIVINNKIMGNKLIILFAFVFVFSIFPQAMSADLIIPGTKSVNWCYEISNINDYPDYVFVFKGVTDYGIINQRDCFNFYKNGLASIYAIQKTEFDKNELNREFFKRNSSKLIKSNIQLNAFGLVQKDDPLQKVVITLDILSLSKNNFDIQKSKVTYTYADGTSEEKVFQSQETMPKQSKITTLPWQFAKFWYVILPIVAIVLINIIFLIRRLKK